MINTSDSVIVPHCRFCGSCWEEKRPEFIAAVRGSLQDRGYVFTKSKGDGNCYATSEAAYHLLGGKKAGWTPASMRHEGTTHWFLRHKSGLVLDLTHSQFKIKPDHSKARGRGFLTKKPSKAGKAMIDKMVYKSQALFKSHLDEDRIRVTEQRMAYNTERIAEFANTGIAAIQFRPQGTCCTYCKSLYENPDGSPKRFPMREFLKGLQQTGGLNKGVSKRNWSPYVVIAHPWCRCRPEAVYA